MGLVLVAGNAMATTQTKTSPDKPARLFLLGDAQVMQHDTRTKQWFYHPDGSFYFRTDNKTWDHYDHEWVSGFGGEGLWRQGQKDESWNELGIHFDNLNLDTICPLVLDWAGGGYGTAVHYLGGAIEDTINISWSVWPKIGNEHCNVSDVYPPPATWDWINHSIYYDPVGWFHEKVEETYSRKADTIWHLQTGGRARPARQNLWGFSGSALEILEKRALPPFSGTNKREITDKTQITLGGLGNLKADGNLWTTLPDDVELDVTPNVTGLDFVTFNVGGQKFTLQIFAGNRAFLEPDAVVKEAHFCVGQYIDFDSYWEPATPPYLANQSFFHWHLPGHYFNAETNHYPTTGGSLDPFVDQTALIHENARGNWWVSGNNEYTASVGMALKFPNGQTASVAAAGRFSMFRPTSTLTSETTSVGVHAGILEFGDSSPAPDGKIGIFFNKTFDSGGFGDSFHLLQVLSNRTRQIMDGSSVWHTVIDNHNLTGPYLDSGNPYPGSSDSPAIDLSNSDFLKGGAHDEFQTWLTFQPSGGHYVPLKLLNWYWGGAATNGPSGWNLSGSSDNHSENPSGTETETYPTWTSAAQDFKYSPPLPP